MKFILAFAPLVSFSVLAKSPSTEARLAYARDSKPVDAIKFSEKDIYDVLNASVKNIKTDPETTQKRIKEFFDRNPTIIKSIMKVANDPKYKAVKEDAIAKGTALYKESKGKAIKENGIKVINYVFDHPKLLQMLQEIGTKLIEDHPGSVDTFFSVFDKLVKKNPSLIQDIKKEIIQFSKDNEEAYHRIFEMIVNFFNIRSKAGAQVTAHTRKYGQIACLGAGSVDCACNETESVVEVKEPSTTEEPNADKPSAIEEPEVESEEPSAIEEPEVDAEKSEIYEPETDTTKPGFRA